MYHSNLIGDQIPSSFSLCFSYSPLVVEKNMGGGEAAGFILRSPHEWYVQNWKIFENV